MNGSTASGFGWAAASVFAMESEEEAALEADMEAGSRSSAAAGGAMRVRRAGREQVITVEPSRLKRKRAEDTCPRDRHKHDSTTVKPRQTLSEIEGTKNWPAGGSRRKERSSSREQWAVLAFDISPHTRQHSSPVLLPSHM